MEELSHIKMGVRQSRTKFNNNMIIEHLSSPFTPLKYKGRDSDIYFAKFSYHPKRSDELELRKGDRVFVVSKEKDDWWQGECNGKWGWFPCNYVDSNTDAPSPDYAFPDDVLPSYKDLCRDAVCTVKTLYPFQSQSNEELSFDKDTILDIIEKPKDDPDWWKARTMRGEIGLVPRNYVREINSYLNGSSLTLNGRGFKSECTFVNADWFHGTLSRRDCHNLLMDYGMVGDFLLRESETKVPIHSNHPLNHLSKSFHTSLDTMCSMQGLLAKWLMLRQFECICIALLATVSRQDWILSVILTSVNRRS